MDFTSQQILKLLPKQFGLDTDSAFLSYITDMVYVYEGYASFPVLYFLLCKQASIEYLLGHHWQDFNNKTGPVTRQEQDIFKNLMELKKEVGAAILLANKQQTALSAMQISPISGTFPITWSYWGGPNSILWRGMPSYLLPDNWDASV